MVFRPEVFVSAALPELALYRQTVLETLKEMGIAPVEHTDFTVPYGPLDGMLKVEIGKCDGVIHLAGFNFGMEPSDRTLGGVRRSFSHYEIDVARALDKPVFCFMAASGTPMTQGPMEDDEARSLQREHRRFLERTMEHWTFSNEEELAAQLRGLRLRLMVRRRFARLPFARKGAALFGRERAMEELQEALETSRVAVLHPPSKFASVSASAGKTALAVETGWQAFESERFDFVFFLPASSRGELESGLASLARMDALALVLDEVAGHQARLKAVRDWLAAPAREDRVLVILDGVDTEVTWWEFKSVLPWFSRARLIVTSRLPLAWPDATLLSIGALSTDASVELLGARNPSDRALPPREQDLRERLVRTLAWQPLALDLAAHLLADRGLTTERLLDGLARDIGSPGAIGLSAPKVVLWQPVFARLVREAMSRLDAPTQAMMRMLVCLAPQPASIPVAIFSGRADSEQARASLSELKKSGLVTTADDAQSILVHRLVREVIRDRLSPEQMSVALDSARAVIEGALPKSERSGSGAAVRERLVPHCRVVLGQINGHPVEVRAGYLARNLAMWLRDCGRLAEAEHFQRRAVHIREREHGKDHLDVAPEMRLLAGILRDRHRYDDAEALHRRAVAILEKQLPVSSNELAAELYNLAACLRAGNQLAKAETILRRALELEERQSGRHHLRTGIAVHAVGMVLEARRRPEEAAEFYRRALEIDEHAAVPSPSRLAVRQHNLATALAASGDRTRAIDYLRRALELDTATFGESHAELVVPLSQLAVWTEEESGPAAAEPIWSRAVEAASKCLEPENPERIACLLGLASVRRELGLNDEADKLVARAEAGLAVIDPDWHPFVRSLRELCQGLKPKSASVTPVE